ncbi:30S ribosomal protein S8 [Candidatus Zinderia endosymbiont of Aphrophora alni]|uniref:30S ribosomal protein S8 n=1 Tax=Candidatus Zinderia endosymbiont of Aphrophora alni TaxID=3077951 RepID=UPI0030D376FF
MSMSDPISDMLTRIRNAQNVKKEIVLIPFSKIKIAIVKIFESEGYIKKFVSINFINKKIIKIYLKYFNNKPVIEILKRISKPGLRVYKKKKLIPKILNGLGVVIVSTTIGIITGKKAKFYGLGGEIICYIA